MPITLMVARLKRLQDLGSREVRWFVWTINTCEERRARSGYRRAAGRKAEGEVREGPRAAMLCFLNLCSTRPTMGETVRTMDASEIPRVRGSLGV